MLPKLDNFKVCAFTRRMTAYHETFAPVGKNNKKPIFSAIWNDSITGRRREDIIAAFRSFFIENKNYKCIKIWLDNCSAQNKNWSLYSFLVQIINSQEIDTKDIILAYFEPGHTHMSADSFHHMVELSMKKKKIIPDWDNFHFSVLKAGKNVVVKDMKCYDFFEYKNFYSQTKLNNKTMDRPILNDIVLVKFCRNNYKMKYKTDMQTDFFKEFDFLQNSIVRNGFPPYVFYENDRGLDKDRKQDIISKMLHLIPPNSRSYWSNLPTLSE